MAYDYFQNIDEEKDQAEQQSKGGVTQVGPEGGTLETGEDKQQNSGTAGTSSGAFTNLQSYLDANKSLNQGAKFAGKVGENVAGAQKAQSEAETGFKQDVDTGSVQKNDALIEAARKTPQQVVADQSKFSDFLKQRDASYAGPRNLVDQGERYQNVSSATDTASERAELTKDEAGRKTLLDTYYGSGNGRYDYTPGQKNLDNLLIQNDPTSREALSKVQSDAAATKQRFGTLKDELASYAGTAATNTAAARAGARGALGIDDSGNVLAFDNIRGNAGALQDAVEVVDERLAQRQAALAKEQELLGFGNNQSLSQFTPEQIARMGIDPEQFKGVSQVPLWRAVGGERGESRTYSPNDDYAKNFRGYQVDPGYLYGVDPRQYAKLTDPSALNRSSVANTEELAQLQALSQLAGVDQSWITDPSVVGSQFDQGLSDYDRAKLTSDVADKRNAFSSELSAVSKKYDDYTAALRTPDSRDTQFPVGDNVVQAQEMIEVNEIRKKYGLPPILPGGVVGK